MHFAQITQDEALPVPISHLACNRQGLLVGGHRPFVLALGTQLGTQVIQDGGLPGPIHVPCDLQSLFESRAGLRMLTQTRTFARILTSRIMARACSK